MKNRSESPSQFNKVIDFRLARLIELAKNMADECFKGKPSKKIANDFLIGIEKLKNKNNKNKVGSNENKYTGD